MTNRISTKIDFDTVGSTRSLGQLRTEVKNTDGAFGKMKVAGSGAMEQIQANAGAMALGAGAALVGFGVKAVGAFTDGALAAGLFADATGLSTEEASKWVSAADDIGISAENVEKMFFKLNKEIGAGNAVLKEWGIESVRGADGQVDVQATMLRTIDVIKGIQDPTKRAEASQEAFGRSYAEVAELIQQGSEGVLAALESTSDAQVFDQAEVDKARDYRAAMDQLGDAVNDLTLAFGEKLAPAVADAAGDLATIVAGIDDVGDALDRLPFNIGDRLSDTLNPTKIFGTLRNINKLNPIQFLADKALDSGVRRLGTSLGFFGDKVEDVTSAVDAGKAQQDAYVAGLKDVAAGTQLATEATEESTTAIEAGNTQMRDYVRGLQNAGRESGAWKRELVDQAAEQRALEADTRRTEVAVSTLENTFARLRGQLSQEAAYDTFKAKLEEIRGEGELTAEQVRDLKSATYDYLEQVKDIPAEKVTEINLLLDQGQYDEVERMLKQLEVVRQARVNVTTNYSSTGGAGGGAGTPYGGQRAHGGPTSAGSMYEVAEGGKSELLHEGDKTFLLAGKNGKVEPMSSSGSGGSPLDLSDATIRKLAQVMTAAAGGAVARNEAGLLAELRGGVR